MNIHEYLQIHDNTYMTLKSLIHDIHNTRKFNTLRMSEVRTSSYWETIS